MRITDWPAAERPREKLLARGADALSDAELLAIFLRTGVAGCSAVDMARRLLSEYGSLSALLSADRARFTATHGLGIAKYAQLQAVLAMARRHADEAVAERDALSDPEATRHFLTLHLAHSEHEVFACIFLDTRNRVIAFEEMFRGTIDGAAVYPREVVKAALRHNAAGLIAAHNHPSGVAEPSRSDRDITRRLADALALVDIRLLDHVIVTASESVSLAERGIV